MELSKLQLHPDFAATIKDVNNINVSCPKSNLSYDFVSDFSSTSNGLVEAIGEIEKINLDPKHGQEIYENRTTTAAYDESIFNFDSLEGNAYITAHALTLLGESVYIPQVYITFYFYTKSLAVSEGLEHVKNTPDPELESKRDYMKDKINFLLENTPENSLLLIDGPLIGGDLYTYMIDAYKEFEKRNIIPLFFVKNSSSNLVSDNLAEIGNKYNSDLHWAYNYLNVGERTSYFKYTDNRNKLNSKVFCYIKAYNGSPQRIEMHTGTYLKHKNLLNDILDMVDFLLLAQGNPINPQLRPIAISELYARNALSLINIRNIIKKIGIVPTINQSRFG